MTSTPPIPPRRTPKEAFSDAGVSIVDFFGSHLFRGASNIVTHPNFAKWGVEFVFCGILTGCEHKGWVPQSIKDVGNGIKEVALELVR
mgnify:CR=1 FL=1